MSLRFGRKFFIMLGIIVVILFFSRAVSEHAPSTAGAVIRTAGKLTISVDPRIELLAVIQSLADYRGFDGRPVLTNLEFPYRDEIAATFGSYADHPAVQQFHEMSTRGFWYSHPPTAMLFLSDPPQLAQEVPYTAFVQTTAGGEETLQTFIEHVRQFARDTDFMAFFEAHRSFYTQVIDSYLAGAARPYIQDLEEYYGYAQHSYTIILAPLFHPGGFGPRIEREPGIFDAYYIGGPREIEDGVLSFGSSRNIEYICWHEFSHSFVNHLTEQHISEFHEPVLALQDAPVLQELKKMDMDPDIHVADWASEHIVRGVTSRLAYHHLGPDTYDERVAFEISQGFPYVSEVAQCLVRYEQNRAAYSTLASFYPELVSVFEQAASNLPGEPLK